MAIFHYLLPLTTTNPKLKDFPFSFSLLLAKGGCCISMQTKGGSHIGNKWPITKQDCHY